MQRSVLAALFGAVACYGVIVMTTPPGPGLDPDSMSYLGAAEALVAHEALRVPFADWSSADSTSPLSHFPPGFSLAIAVPVALGAPPVQAARAVEAVAALGTVALAVWLVATVAGSGAAVLAGILLLASPSLAFDHWQVLSEPLCLALLMATVGLMAFSRRPWTYGVTAAAAGMVRFAGAAAVGAAVLWAFGLRGTWRARLRRAATAGVPGVLVEGAWLARGAIEGGESRQIAWHGALAPTFHELRATLCGWLAPLVPWAGAQALCALFVACLAAAAIVGAARHAPPAAPEAGLDEDAGRARRLLAAAGVMGACYAGLVLTSRLFVYDSIPFDQRLLSPLIMIVEVVVAASCGVLWRRWRRATRLAVTLAWALWLGASGWATVQAVEDARDGGWGYASDEWRASGLARWLRAAGREAAIFSNNPATAFAVTGRPSRNVPEALDPDTVAAFAQAFRARRALLVRFPFDLEPGAPPDSLAVRLGLREIAGFADGEVWGLTRAGAGAPVRRR